jgi:hypothetical protein
VTAHQGRVTLSGPVLANEVTGLLSSVSAVQGVTQVENQLEVPAYPGHISGLQGGGRPRRQTAQQLAYTSPTTRTLMGVGGGLLVLYGVASRSTVSVLLGTMGLSMFAGGLTKP